MQGKSNVDISKLEHARKKFCWPSLLLKCIVVSKRHRLTACLRWQLCRGRGWEWRMNTNDKSWWSWYVMDPTSSRQQPFVSEHMSDISSSSCCLSACVQRPAASSCFPRDAEGRRDGRRKGGGEAESKPENLLEDSLVVIIAPVARGPITGRRHTGSRTMT